MGYTMVLKKTVRTGIGLGRGSRVRTGNKVRTRIRLGRGSRVRTGNKVRTRIRLERWE